MCFIVLYVCFHVFYVCFIVFYVRFNVFYVWLPLASCGVLRLAVATRVICMARRRTPCLKLILCFFYVLLENMRREGGTLFRFDQVFA